MSQEIISIDETRCTLCGLCIEVCSKGVIEEGEASARIKDASRCFLCGHCKSVCPEDALILHTLNGNEFEPVPEKSEIPEPDKLLAFFRSRRSIRSFKKDPVPKAVLEQLVQAGRFAPTGGNRQPVRYVILHTPESINTIRTMTNDFLYKEAQKTLDAVERHEKYGDPLPPRIDIRMGYVPIYQRLGKLYERGRDLLLYHAPAVVILHLNPEQSSPFGSDAGLAAMQMVLMAEAMGIGTCFIGFLTAAINNSPDLKKQLMIPIENDILLSIVLGYPEDKAFLRLVSRNPANAVYL